MTYHPDRWQPVVDAVNARLDDLGWDQATFTRRAGLSDASVRPFMTGKFRSNPRKVTVMKVEDALGWQRGSVDDMLAGLEPTIAEDPSGEVAPRPGEIAPSELPVLMVELRRLIAGADYRDNALAALQESTAEIAAELRNLMDLVLADTERIARLDEYVRSREVAPQRASKPR